MASSYTHYRFGKEIISILTKNHQQIKYGKEILELILKHKNIYNAGLNGPDVLFYYKALKRNEISSIGYDMHEKPASDFLKTVAYLNESSEIFSYLMGFVCHFALDSECHPYIEYRINKTGICHTEIESDFEKEMMKKNNINPQKYNAVSHVEVSEPVIKSISSVYGVEESKIKSALKSMHSNGRLLLSGGFFKNTVVEIVLKATGNYEDMKGLLMWRDCDKTCKESTEYLIKLFDGAIPIALELMSDFYTYCKDGGELSLRFNRTFGADEDIMKTYS